MSRRTRSFILDRWPVVVGVAVLVSCLATWLPSVATEEAARFPSGLTSTDVPIDVAYVDSSNTNYGTAATFVVNNSTTTATVTRAFFKGDFSVIPPNHAIFAAHLRILPSKTLSTVDTTDAYQLGVYRCLKPWTEAGVTWNTYDGVNNWTTAGAKARRSRFNGGSNIDTSYVSLNGGDIAYPPILFWMDGVTASTEIQPIDITEYVQNWHNGQWRNDGAMISYLRWLASGTAIQFHSDDAVTEANRPYIRVYHAAPGVASVSIGGRRKGGAGR